MPGTARVTVCSAAQAGALKTQAAAIAVRSLFMRIPFDSIKQGSDIGKRQRHDDQRGDDPEQQPVGGVDLGNGADLARFAGRRRSEQAAPGEEQGDESRADENRPIRFEQGEVADPRAADAQRQQDQRAQATGRGQDGRERAGKQRATPGGRVWRSGLRHAETPWSGRCLHCRAVPKYGVKPHRALVDKAAWPLPFSQRTAAGTWLVREREPRRGARRSGGRTWSHRCRRRRESSRPAPTRCA